MARRPDEIEEGDDATRFVAHPRGPSPDAITEEPVGPVRVCGSCGATNPAGRTLCERCGMGLLSADDIDDTPERVWARPGRILVLVGAVVIGAVVGWFVLRDVGGPGELAVGGGGNETGDGGQQAAVTPAPSVAASQPPPTVELRPGDSGEDVRAWQESLRAAGFDIRADGVFGPATEDATRQFQAATGEEPTGEVTSRTLAAGDRASSLAQVDIFLVGDGDQPRRQRLVEETQLARGAVEALLAAPLESERAQGLSTAIPDGAAVDAVTVDAGTATVRLRGFAADTDGGDLRTRVDQVVRTLTRFPSIDDVRILLPDDETAVFVDAGVALGQSTDQGDG